MELKHTQHAVGQSAYHFVWRPKYNVKVFAKEFPKKICEDAIQVVARKWSIQIIELKITPIPYLKSILVFCHHLSKSAIKPNINFSKILKNIFM